MQWVLTDVVGSEDGLGVECLSGSGAIAAAFNKAFRWGLAGQLRAGRGPAGRVHPFPVPVDINELAGMDNG